MMRGRLRAFLLAVVLAGAGGARAAPAGHAPTPGMRERPVTHAIVWASSADAESLGRWLSQVWSLEAAQIGRMATLAEGFPRIVQGGDVTGLSPGRAWLVLGYCPADSGASLLLELLQGFRPGVSTRRVEVPPEQMACPVLLEKGALQMGTRTVRVGSRQLTVSRYFNLGGSYAVDFISVLRESSVAQAVDVRTVTIRAEEDPIDCKVRLQALPSAIAILRRCPVDPGCRDPGSVLERYDYSVRGGSIVETKRRVVLRTQRCDD